MKHPLSIVACLLTMLALNGGYVNGIAWSQTLTEKLVAEDPAELVAQSQQRGDIVRGAILFHQGNINCAKCHRGDIGPDLSRLGPKVTNESLVESILLPSKEIKDEYKTVTALMLDGTVVTGMLGQQDEKAISIRDLENIDTVTTLSREDIDELRPGEISIMPANLANQLKNRDQFLDLLRYVIDIKERGPQDVKVNLATQKHRLKPELEGLIGIKKFNCTACHVGGSSISALPPTATATKAAPLLKWSARNLNPAYLQAFIANPHSVKPETTMPDLFGAFDDSLRQKSAAAITNYLTAESGNTFKKQPIDHEAAQRGFTNFNQIGCVACHNPRDREGKETLSVLTDWKPLGNLSGKYNVDALMSFLKDPLAVRRSGHMPNMRLTHREASDITHFLLQNSEPETDEFVANKDLADRGKLLFTAMNCASCHSEFQPDLARQASQMALDKVDPTEGCLSGQIGGWPKFNFGVDERPSIRAFLQEPLDTLTSEEQIQLTMRSHNCIACHQREDLGGITPELNPHFTTTNLNLGDQGRIPPALTGVGAKLKRSWMRDVLVVGQSIRPYMHTRMPQYGEKNVGHLVELLQSVDKLPATEFANFEDQKETRQWGQKLAGNEGLNCVACHTYKFKLSDTMPAVDLTQMHDRLKKDWFYRYMLAPQEFSPNTVMPSFWPQGKAIRPDIKGEPADQIEAIWQYLIDGRQARPPAGVVKELLEIVVSDSAQILRRRYPGVGKRGIGVGYPGGINLTFDAEQMRLAMIWSGGFVDPSAVWTGQGSGFVRPLGKTVEFPKGPDLDGQNSPWIADDGRPPDHRFKGYFLDEQQRPTFMYSYQQTKIEDYFVERITASAASPENSANATDEKAPNVPVGLLRTITVTAEADAVEQTLRLRLADGEIDETDEGFAVGDRLLIRVRSEHEAKIAPEAQKRTLSVPIKLKPGDVQTLQIEYTLKPAAQK